MAIIYSTGFQQSITNDGSNSKPLINEIQWDADYKNNQGKMNVNINKNGKKNKYQVKLNKNDLENILKMPTVNQSLDQRLAHDFPILESESLFPKQNILNKSQSKSKRNYDELEDLFTLRKKLMTPYHFTHHGTTNKTRKANKAKEAKQQTKQNPKKKVNNKKSRKNKNNKAKGVTTKFFNQFF
jgi:hypothetical protein